MIINLGVAIDNYANAVVYVHCLCECKYKEARKQVCWHILERAIPTRCHDAHVAALSCESEIQC